MGLLKTGYPGFFALIEIAYLLSGRFPPTTHLATMLYNHGPRNETAIRRFVKRFSTAHVVLALMGIAWVAILVLVLGNVYATETVSPQPEPRRLGKRPRMEPPARPDKTPLAESYGAGVATIPPKPESIWSWTRLTWVTLAFAFFFLLLLLNCAYYCCVHSRSDGYRDSEPGLDHQVVGPGVVI